MSSSTEEKIITIRILDELLLHLNSYFTEIKLFQYLILYIIQSVVIAFLLFCLEW